MYSWHKVTEARLAEIKSAMINNDDVEILDDRVIDNRRKMIWYV